MTYNSDWYDALAAALTSGWLSERRIAEIVAEAKAHCEATGERPYEAFGDADSYASHLVSIEDPEETRWADAHRRPPALSPGAWLERLQGLPEGRHQLSAAKAREFRAEAESHLEESGGDPEWEFGPVDDCAAKLAYRSGLSRRRQKEPLWFVKLVATLFGAGVTVAVIANHGLFSVRTAIIAGVTLVLAVDLLDLAGAVNRRKRIPVQAGRR